MKRADLEYLSEGVGWIYTIAWSLSFYPQILLNYRRKSVRGLSIDFTLLNVLGHTALTTSNAALLLSGAVRREYAERYHGGQPSTRVNDLVFAGHAFVMALFTWIQTLVYERAPGQGVSALNQIVLSLFVLLILGAAAVAASNEAYFAAETAASSGDDLGWARSVRWLDFVYLLSMVKVYATFAKNLPQAWYNYRRKSTAGWSIDTIFCDFVGGAFSFMQLLLDAALAGGWESMVANPGKLGLAVVSLGYDTIFLYQHYILYRFREPQERLNGADIEESIASLLLTAEQSPERVPLLKAD